MLNLRKQAIPRYQKTTKAYLPMDAQTKGIPRFRLKNRAERAVPSRSAGPLPYMPRRSCGMCRTARKAPEPPLFDGENAVCNKTLRLRGGENK